MHEPDTEGIYKELEQDLAKLHRSFPMDPDFVAGVEGKILNRAAKISGQTKAKGASPWNKWIAGVFSTGRALAWGILAVLLVAGLGWSIRHFLPKQMQVGGSGEAGIPTPASALIERFIWQSDGRFGYRMLRPVNWVPVDLRLGRGYASAELRGTTDPLELRALNYQVLQETQGSADGAIAQWLLFQQNPKLEDWTTGAEQMWQQNGVEFTLEETLSRAKVYWIQVPGWDKIQLSAFVVDQDQPLAIELTAGGVYADVDRLRNEGILDDFITMVESLSAISYSPENVDPPLNEVNSIPPTTTTVDHPATTPASTESPGNLDLNLNTPHDEIRRLILNPTWQTLWIQGQASLFSPTGVQQNFYVQAWLDREGAGRVLSTGQIPGSLNFNLDMDPLWIWISDGETLSLFDVQAGRFDPSAADQQWFVHPLETAGQAMGMLFPSYLAVRSEDLEVIELGEQAGRPALVVDWAHFRLWVDAQTGVLLRQQTRDENGQVSQDIFLTAIAYDLRLPEGVLSLENLEGVRFEPAPVEVPTQILMPQELEPPDPSPVPARIVFDAKVLDSTELFVMDEGGLTPIQLTHSGGINFDAACSLQGDWIAFTGIRDGQRDIYRIRPDGSEETQLTNSAWQEMYPAFSPDGQKIAYTALQADGNADIYVMNLDGSDSIRLTDHPAFDSAPAWSPDGSQIAFESERDGHWQIYIMNADGSGQLNLSNNRFMDHEPTWSPDGKKIAFHSDNRVSGGNEVIYVMSLDGVNAAALTPETAGPSQRNMGPAWSPDGNWIAFTAYRDGATSEILKTPADGSGQIGLHIALTPITLEAANPCWLPVTYPIPDAPGQEPGGGTGSNNRPTATIKPFPDDPSPTPNPNEAGTGLGTGTVTGRIVTGYGDHSPAAGERVQVLGLEDMVQEVRTDGNGSFTITGLPVGRWNLVARHLSFQVTIPQPGETVDLGLLKYPLGHPPPYYLQTPAAAPDLAVMDSQGQVLPFTVVASNPHWERPEEFVQQDRVWSTQPFSDMGESLLRWWFRQPAVLYDTRDIFSQSFPGGLNLDPLGADWRYLLGLGTADDFLSQAEFYGPEQLNDLLAWRQVEIWLLGYQAKEVKRLGDHYLVKVGPAPGFQVIRFAGHAGPLQVHVASGGTEIITLPKSCRSPGQPDCDH